MRLILSAQKSVWQPTETIVVRLLALNDDFEPAAIDRRLLVGPNIEYTTPRMPFPVQVEPAFGDEQQNLVMLNPACLYGRERTFAVTEPGVVRFHGYLLLRESGGLLATGPVNVQDLQVAAEPLEMTIEAAGTPTS